MIKAFKTTAIILSQKHFGEADRLLTLFTRDKGKVRLLAKGVRKVSSRKRGHLEIFSHAKISGVKAKNLDLILEAETINNFSRLRANLNRVRIAYLFCELVNELTAENQENSEVYELLLDALGQLNQSATNKNLIIDFEKSLLQILGFGLPDKIDQTSLETYIASLTEKPLQAKKIV